jgi:hypothetical protein
MMSLFFCGLSCRWLRACHSPRHGSGKPITLLLAALIAPLITTPLSAAELVPFTANYSSQYGMLSASGVRKLEKRGDGNWGFENRASAMLNEVVETSTFTLRDQRVTPLNYNFRNPFNAKRNLSLSFNWSKAEVTDSIHNNTLPLSGEVYDKLSYQLQMQQDVCSSPDKFAGKNYTVVDLGRLKTYRIERVDRQALATKAGTLDTIHLRQFRPDKQDGKDTLIWLAADFNCVLVRLDQREGDGVIRLDLTSANVNGREVKGK